MPFTNGLCPFHAIEWNDMCKNCQINFEKIFLWQSAEVTGQAVKKINQSITVVSVTTVRISACRWAACISRRWMQQRLAFSKRVRQERKSSSATSCTTRPEKIGSAKRLQFKRSLIIELSHVALNCSPEASYWPVQAVVVSVCRQLRQLLHRFAIKLYY